MLLRPHNLCVSVLQRKRPDSKTPPPGGVPTNGKGVAGKRAQQGPAHRKLAKKVDADRLYSGAGKKRSAPSQDPDVVSTVACCLFAIQIFLTYTLTAIRHQQHMQALSPPEGLIQDSGREEDCQPWS